MKEKLFIAVILLLCLVPSVGMLLPRQTETGGNEVLTPLPALRDNSGAVNMDYLPQLSQYVEDHYFFRQQLVSGWSALNQNILHTSIASGVVLGRDGWLYFSDTLHDYTGADLMTDREIFCAARNLALTQEYCMQQGAKFLFTIAPNKNSLYPEHMPRLTVSPHQSNAGALAERLAQQTDAVPYVDLFSLFRQQEETLYFSQDSHWNSKGAALAADAISGETSYFQQPFLPQANHLSDLYRMLYPTGKWLETDQTYGGELHFTYDKPLRSAEDLTIQTSGGSVEKSLVMFRDSFGNLLYPYLADTFAHALFSRSMPYKMELAAQRQADLVVVELVERNLDYLVQNAPVMPAPERMVPEAPVPLPQAISLQTEEAPQMLVKGTLPVEPDIESPVYLCMGEKCWEAFLLEDNGFALYLPEWSGLPLSVVFTASGEMVSAPASIPH